MFKSLRRLFGFDRSSPVKDQYDPIYGLPRRAVDEWLKHNPVLKQEYDAMLRARLLLRDRRSPKQRRPRNSVTRDPTGNAPMRPYADP
jgi:hypothetical protein